MNTSRRNLLIAAGIAALAGNGGRLFGQKQERNRVAGLEKVELESIKAKYASKPTIFTLDEACNSLLVLMEIKNRSTIKIKEDADPIINFLLDYIIRSSNNLNLDMAVWGASNDGLIHIKTIARFKYEIIGGEMNKLETIPPNNPPPVRPLPNPFLV